MWPRGDTTLGPGADMTATRRNKSTGLSGFVSFMRRRDAEAALRELDGFDWGGSVLRVGWSKAVPIAAKPMFGMCITPYPPYWYCLSVAFKSCRGPDLAQEIDTVLVLLETNVTLALVRLVEITARSDARAVVHTVRGLLHPGVAVEVHTVVLSMFVIVSHLTGVVRPTTVDKAKTMILRTRSFEQSLLRSKVTAKSMKKACVNVRRITRGMRF